MTFSEELVQKITEQLVQISTLKKEEKLSVSSAGDITICKAGFGQGIMRAFRFDKGEHTINFLSKLYPEAFKVMDEIAESVDFNVPALPNKTQLTAPQDKNYRNHRDTLRRITLWLDKSRSGLENLQLTYPLVPRYVTLLANTNEQLDKINLLLLKLEKCYAKLLILGSLDDSKREKKHRDSSASSSSSSSSSSSVPPSGSGHPTTSGKVGDLPSGSFNYPPPLGNLITSSRLRANGAIQ